MIEEVDPLYTPLRVHKNADELWYVLEGEHIVQVGDDEFHVGPGDRVRAPRRSPCAAQGGAANGAIPRVRFSGGIRGFP